MMLEVGALAVVVAVVVAALWLAAFVVRNARSIATVLLAGWLVVHGLAICFGVYAGVALPP